MKSLKQSDITIVQQAISGAYYFYLRHINQRDLAEEYRQVLIKVRSLDGETYITIRDRVINCMLEYIEKTGTEAKNLYLGDVEYDDMIRFKIDNNLEVIDGVVEPCFMGLHVFKVEERNHFEVGGCVHYEEVVVMPRGKSHKKYNAAQCKLFRACAHGMKSKKCPPSPPKHYREDCTKAGKNWKKL